MATLIRRRPSLSLSNGPRITIPTHKQVEEQNYQVPSPPSSGSISPNLQPNTPPVLPPGGKKNQVLQIGSYLLLEQTDAGVYKAVHIETQQEKICKVFKQRNYRQKIAAYCRLHENAKVVEINEIIQGNENVYVFFSQHYGDLHSYVRDRKRLKEHEARPLYRQIAEAVDQCHSSGVIIRDLKLRKFVFVNPERTEIQLEGLEDSCVLEEEDDDTLRDKQGCPAYVSPEILERAQYGYSGKASDQWSSGVMLYTMLIGRYPFHETEPSKLFEKIKQGHYTIPNSISAKGKCLIRNLLRRNADERLTSEEVAEHPWFSQSEIDDRPTARSKISPSAFRSSKDGCINDQLVPCSL